VGDQEGERDCGAGSVTRESGRLHASQLGGRARRCHRSGWRGRWRSSCSWRRSQVSRRFRADAVRYRQRFPVLDLLVGGRFAMARVQPPVKASIRLGPAPEGSRGFILKRFWQ
jgi:hypothetical protein